ncbi:MAG TPA: YebC/PmpR family DNA-binding transcriptional regulator [Chloroflexota bacterium]|nr:YebC/PmpR family DNA-binding transcriptional regulator [Chloroflexota bacterium]
MSGHSKWAQIKRQKGVNDNKRGQVFTKLGREITVAARDGGGDPNANFRLRLAVQHARENNMPMDNIERAIKRGTGGGEGAALEEITYEGYGVGGAAILVEAMTDNRNRAAADVRSVFTRHGGSLGETGCVNWLFDSRGIISIDVGKQDPDELALLAIDAGADDVKVEDGSLEVYTAPGDLESVRQALEANKLTITNAEVSMIPKTTVELDPKGTVTVLKMVEKLEDLDDVQAVYSNIEVSDEALAEFS